MDESIKIDELIKTVKDPALKELLSKFRQKFDQDALIFVTEFQDYFRLYVVYPSGCVYSRGDVTYLLDKKTGHTEMIQHSHPIPVPICSEVKKITEEDLEQIKKKGTEK